MKPKSVLPLLLITILAGLSAFQTKQISEFLITLRDKLATYNKTYPDERVYLHMDKPFYKPGEDIWFNAFILSGTSMRPSQTSDIVHVELIDPKGNVTSKLDLLVNEGCAGGDFSIPPSAPGGIYKIRAYTNWTQNFGDEGGFTKDVQVQRVITPRLLFKFDFEKKGYGAGDEVRATLNIRNLKNEPVSHAEIRVMADLKGIRHHESSLVSDANGDAVLSFTLPSNLDTRDGLLQAIVTTDGISESLSRSIPIVIDKISVQFFPEGGEMLAGLETRVAFKALNEFGKGADISGAIVDEDGNIITPIESFHLGMGASEFTPQEAKRYFARLNTPAGNNDLMPLPAVSPHGMAVRILEQNEGFVTLAINATAAQDAFIVGQSHGAICFDKRIALKKGTNKIEVSTRNFPMGIAVFTVFDSDGNERSERLVFLNNNKKLNITITPNKKKYLPREKVQLSIKTTDAGGEPIPARLSLSVTDDQLISFADDRQDNLVSHMLLSTEVRGKIEEPSFYFKDDEPKAVAAMDYLLMTQGWRRFTWKEVQSPSKSIVFLPEKTRTISGSLLDKNGNELQGEVTLLELGSRQRAVKLQTTENGQFAFKNTDPTIPVLLLSDKRGTIVLDNDKIQRSKPRDLIVADNDPSRDAVIVTEAEPAEDPMDLGYVSDGGIDVSMNSDVAQLSEVVVVGYGVASRKELSSSVVVIQSNDIPFSVISNGLQGRVAGVEVQSQQGNPGSPAAVQIRGFSSLYGARAGNEPLYIIDGYPVAPDANQNFPTLSMLNPDDIESIQVLKSPEGSSLYGGAAANGVIIITTKSRLYHTNASTIRRHERYSSLIVPARKFTTAREFYAPPPGNNDHERQDFRTTVYWNNNIVTDEKGNATVSFYNNDAVSAFRITTEGISGIGLIGRSETVYYTLLPFSLDTKIPEYLGYEDVLQLPVHVRNETDAALSARITIETGEGLHVKESRTNDLEVSRRGSNTLYFTITPTGKTGEFPIFITVEANGRRDEVKQVISVRPSGFPVRLSFSGKEAERHVRFRITDAEKGTINASFEAFPDVLSDLMTGVESIFREPYGCFEQTSSSTFPNILALQYLRNSGRINPAIEQRAMRYIEAGYKRLISFEVEGGGFDWFGKPAAHEGLTAYGLIEFVEMKKVYPEVDQRLIDRTRRWLLSRKTGDGTFKLYQKGLDDFSRPSGYVSNAYITYALSETGSSAGEIENEYRHSLGVALKNKDMYQLALMANVAHNLNRKSDYMRIVTHFLRETGSGMDNLTASHSVVWGQGISLGNEVVALWALALMKDGKDNLTKINECIRFITSRRSYGMFGSTQATVLCLKAIAEYARLIRSESQAGQIHLLVNGELKDKTSYAKGNTDKIELRRFGQSFGDNGDQRLSVQFLNTPDPLPYSVNVEWYTKMPQSNAACKVEVNTFLASDAVKLNETVRLSITLQNKSDHGIPMTLAAIGLPAGLSAQPWQLKELQEKEVFDFYEIKDGKLILYYRQMMAKEKKHINLDLKAEVKGSFTASASSAYLYYTNEHKHWTKGVSVRVN